MKNPLFESLISQANSYRRDPNLIINEQTGQKFDAKVTQEYTVQILDLFISYLDVFITSSPSQSVLSDAVPIFIDGMSALSKESSIDNVFKGLNEIWGKCYDIAIKNKIDGNIMPFYEKADECIKYMMEAYKALKEGAGESQMGGKELSEFIKEKMEKKYENLKSRISSNRQTIEDAKK